MQMRDINKTIHVITDTLKQEFGMVGRQMHRCIEYTHIQTKRIKSNKQKERQKNTLWYV